MSRKVSKPDVTHLFERKGQPLLSRKKFYSRVYRYFLFSVIILAGSLGIGTVGYHYFGQISWLDGFYNSAMILTGMGPVNPMLYPAGKVFSSLYALFSGIAFLSMVAVFMAPILHRFLHSLNIDPENNPEGEGEN